MDFGVPLVLAASISLSVFITENCLVEVIEKVMHCSELEASKSGCLIASSNKLSRSLSLQVSQVEHQGSPRQSVYHNRFFHLKFLYSPCPISLTSLLCSNIAILRDLRYLCNLEILRPLVVPSLSLGHYSSKLLDLYIP